MLRLYLPAEVIAIITMNIKIGDVEGLMNICLPYITLESVIDKLNTRYWYSNIPKIMMETNYRNAIESLIQNPQIPVKAVLGKSLISVKDFLPLVPGDVIRLDTNVDDELDIYVGNIKKFTALPGSSGDKYAVRITSVVREGAINHGWSFIAGGNKRIVKITTMRRIRAMRY